MSSVQYEAVNTTYLAEARFRNADAAQCSQDRMLFTEMTIGYTLLHFDRRGLCKELYVGRICTFPCAGNIRCTANVIRSVVRKSVEGNKMYE